MDIKNIKSTVKAFPIRAFFLLCLSVSSVGLLISYIDLIDKLNFEISIWLSAAILLCAIGCAWRVAIIEDDRQNVALIQSSNSVDTNHPSWDRNEFGKGIH
jgi:hypothetical protein